MFYLLKIVTTAIIIVTIENIIVRVSSAPTFPYPASATGADTWSGWSCVFTYCFGFSSLEYVPFNSLFSSIRSKHSLTKSIGFISLFFNSETKNPNGA